MSILDLAKSDLIHITGNGDGFAQSIKLTAPGGETITVYGQHAKINFGFNAEGLMVNTRKAHVAIAESLLVGYPVRNAAGDVAMLNHRVEVADSTGSIYSYIVSEHFPDETLGLIVCILGAFEE
jgi:hypothetical protein